MKYFKVFNTESEYLEYISSDKFITPNVSTLYDSTKTWITEEIHDYSKDYFTIESLEDNNEIKLYRINAGGNMDTLHIAVSTDGGNTWTEFALDGSTENTTDIATLNQGEKVMFKFLSGATSRAGSSHTKIISTASFNVYGNVMSFVSAGDFTTATTLFDYNSPLRLLNGSRVVSAENLVLPATTLVNNCYNSMFSGCTSLIEAPELPATTMNNDCYKSMFDGCISLRKAPKLPATTLAARCYRSMFGNCTNLEEAPELPSTTLANECYYYMFVGCTSLTTAPELPATTLAKECYRSMFEGCTSLTTAPELPATTLASNCYLSMFRNCTSLTTAPELPATEFSGGCYNSMFINCTSLTTAPDKLPATTLTSDCYRQMFYGCTSLTTAPELPATTLVNNCYREMFKGCSNLNYIKCLAIDISASDCTTGWVNGVSATGTFVKASSASWSSGASAIPNGWTVHNDTYVEVTGVTISASATTVNKGSTYTLTANVLPSNAYDQVVSWSTSDSNVATVSDGVVTGIGCGDATITVTTHEKGYTATCNMSVENHVTSVDLDVYQLYLGSGGTYQLKATVLPSDACDKSVTWSSSDVTIAAVDSNGLVSGVTTGDAVVTVETVDGGLTKNCSITVTEPKHVTSVTLSDAAITVSKGAIYTLTATVLPDDAVDKSVIWSSSDNTIATVDSNGIVRGVESGNCIITVATNDGGYTAQCNASVVIPAATTLVIEGATSISAESCNYVAIADNSEDVTTRAMWSITNGSQYATINPNNGNVTILNGASESTATIQAIYGELTATTNVTLTYVSGATSETETESTTDIGGNTTTVTTTVTEYEDGSKVEASDTIVTDDEGNVIGSSKNNVTTNADGSYKGVTTNYDANGDPTDGANVTGDTEGNVSTQTVEYDESGNTVVTGYDIDTSGSESGKTFMSGGTNTEYYAFDLTHGFILDFDFTIDFSNQPPGQSDNHHNILTAKRANPEPWYGFQVRHSSTNKYIQLGTQFATGSNTNTTINPSSTSGNVGSYNLRIIYDPTSTGTTFTCLDMANYSTVFTSTLLFPDLEELKYLKITIGNAIDADGNPFRYSNITVHNFELKRLKHVANPTMAYENGAVVISCSTVGASVYYRLNLSGSYSAYTTPITITADTVVQAYATYSGDTSDIVREDFEIVDVTGVTLSDNSIAIGQGRTYTLSATVLPNDALDKSVVWSSSDSNVVSVDSNGVVSGVASGSATVTVTTHDGGYTAQCAVSVSASPYTELEYIESTSTGGQYIDLGIKLYETLNAWYDIAIKYNVSGAGSDNEQPTLFGCQTQSSPWPGTFIRMNNASETKTIGRYIGGSSKDNILGNNGTDIELPVQTAPNKNVTNLNNGGKTHSWGTSLFCSFSDASGTPFRFIAAKLYYFKLFSKTSGTSQGTLIRDMMPCKRNSDNAIGLLDKVNNVFYTNPSGDAFVAGPVVNS